MTAGPVAAILVVEDNPISRKLLRLTLEAEGYHVLEAPDGATALACLAAGAPDLILQDLHLPDMDGFDLVRRLRSSPNGKAVPILALSGFLARLEEAQAQDVGFNGFLVKPIGTAHLVESVRLFLPRCVLDAPSAGQGRAALLVAEDTVERACTERVLGAMGFRVALAGSGEEGLVAALADPPAVILVDLLLPDLDGLALCHKLRHEPRLARVPVVVTTAPALDDEARDLVLAVGANAFISRRTGLEDVGKALLEAVERGALPPGAMPLKEARSRLLRNLASQLKRSETANASLVQQCTIQSSQISVLGNLCEALAGAGDPADLLGMVLASSLDAAGVSKGALFLLDPGGRLALNQAIGYLPEDTASLETFFGRSDLLDACLFSGAILTPTDQKEGPHLSLPEGLSALLAPIVHAGKALGVLFLVTRRADLRGADPLAFVRALAAELAQALTVTAAYSRLAESEERYRGIVESTTEGVWTIDLNRRTTFVNQRISDLLGYPVEEMLGRHIYDFLEDGQLAIATETSGLTLQGIPMSREMKLRHRDGTERWVHLSTAPLLDASGRPAGAMALVGDRSEQKKMQEQLMTSDRMASVGTLAAGVAHEMNNPLTVVLANLELAQADVSRLARRLGEDALRPLAEQCQHAHEAATRVAQIVRDLKLFSRAEEDVRQPVDLRPVLESTLRMAWNEIRHRARLVKDYQPVPRVLGNEARLGQVFLNLLVNAAQAIPEGRSEDHVIRVVTAVSEGGKVAVDISDSGAGMSPEVLGHLFTPFFTTKPVGVGTGLGLSICHRIITGMGGEIGVTSVLGQGTTFRVLLPVAQGDPLPACPPAPEQEAAERRGRILVVDDEPLVAAVLSLLLSPDHDVTVHAHAQDALAQIQTGARFDLILCDLMMPTMTGMDLHEALSRSAPDQARRMVFMSGGAFTAGARDFLAQVENLCVDKPFDLASIKRLARDRTR